MAVFLRNRTWPVVWGWPGCEGSPGAPPGILFRAGPTTLLPLTLVPGQISPAFLLLPQGQFMEDKPEVLCEVD